MDTVWVVNRPEEFDGLYVFVDDHRAREYAARYGDDAVVGEEVVMNDSAAAQFLINTADDDETAWEQEYDHSRAKEDARNSWQLARCQAGLTGELLSG